MIKARILLIRFGNNDYDFETKIVKPKVGEIISIKGNHYDIKFIQYMFDNERKFKHILVTAVKQ